MRFRCPTLVVAGSQDRAVPLHPAQMLHNGIAGSSLVMVEGGDHTLIWTHTDEFLRIREGFPGT